MPILMKSNLFTLLLVICASYLFAQGAASETIYVDFNVTQSATATGTIGDPYGDLVQAINDAAANAQTNQAPGEVIILDGTYNISSSQSISTAATEAYPVTIRPQTPYGVTLNFDARSLFSFELDSRWLTVEGFNIDGNTDQTDFWCIVAEDLWSVDGNPDGGGLAVILDGQHLTVRNNYIHDCYQKGVEIRSGRYVNVEGNIIQKIATTSLSGGHGIMRQQKGMEYMDDDLNGVYRWDIFGNFIFNVEQRIYSWVPSKGFMEMVIDEGKSILIDDPKDTDDMQENMSARIRNNVVAFGAVDHIRLKSTPNLEVSNNSVFATGDEADGITDKKGDDNPSGNPSPATFTGFKLLNNAVQIFPERPRLAFDAKDAIEQGAGTTGFEIAGNYAGGGSRTNFNDGVTKVNQDLFTDPLNGDFTLRAGIPTTVGVEPAVLSALAARATGFNISIGADDFDTDNLLLTQTILDNMPGVYDGVAGNETVLSDFGTIHFETETTEGVTDTVEIDITAAIEPGTAWRAARIDSPRPRPEVSEERFVFGPVYTEWYLDVLRNAEVQAGNYARLRHGAAYVKQNFTTPADWLTVAAISGADEVTHQEFYDNVYTTGGDLLVRFLEGAAPAPGDSWVLASAGTISDGLSARGSFAPFFDNILVEGGGLTADELALTTVAGDNGQTDLVLTVIEALPVTLLSFTGTQTEKQQHLLSWETASEVDNRHFEVQRSTNGNDFTTLGLVNAGGETGARYEFLDESPLSGTNTYRLRQVDYDGTFSLSGLVQLTVDAAALPTAYPNPFTTRLSVPLIEGSADIQLFSADGREVTSDITAGSDGAQLLLNTSRLPTGAYLLHYGGRVVQVVKR